jgi:hypothetical protein
MATMSNLESNARRALLRPTHLIALFLLAVVGCPGGTSSKSNNSTGSGGSGVAGVGAAGMGSGGMGSGGMGSGGSSAPASTWTQVFDMMYPMATNARCTACHSQPPFDVANGNLQMGMDKESAYMALVGKKSTSTKCGGMSYVVPGHPEMSLLYLKLTATPPCGVRMPNGGDMFSQAQLDMVSGWITAGAKDD